MSIEAQNESPNGELVESMFGKLKPEDFVRGPTPDDINQQCLDLCKTYVGGAWNNVISTDDIVVSRIAGGLTNQLYRVSLKAKTGSVEEDIAIKLYQPKHIKNFEPNDDERLNDTIVNTILSQIGLGPQVFSIFSGGMVQRFYENEQFVVKHQANPVLLKKLIHSLARVHHLQVPIRKDPYGWLREIENAFTDAYENCNASALIEELKLTNLSARDPRAEFQEVCRYISALESPIVFCHNDFRGSNILVTKPDEQLILTDLEYSAYGLRAHDIANYLTEWGCQPLDMDKHDLPSDEVLKYFAGLYIEACDQLVPSYAAKPENSLERIVKEVKVMTLEKYMFMLAFLMQTKESLIASLPFDPKQMMKMSESIYEKYFYIKNRLIQDGTIKV